MKKAIIYQLNNEHEFMLFKNMEELQEAKIQPHISQYTRIYEKMVPESATWTPVQDLLEELYMLFNTKIPEDFRGHSMSVSDVVVIENVSGEKAAHFCDNIGFVELEGFFEE